MIKYIMRVRDIETGEIHEAWGNTFDAIIDMTKRHVCCEDLYELVDIVMLKGCSE